MKKAMILLLAMLLTFTLSGSASPAAEIAESEEYRFIDFTYTPDQNGYAEITGYRGDDRDLRVPSEVDGHPVTSIGDAALWRCYGLSSVTLPKGLRSINDAAFYECFGLASVILPEGLKSIGDEAFTGCRNLASVPLPEGLESIGDGAFSGCSGLSSVTLPDSLMSMTGNPFIGLSDLSYIRLSPDHPVFAVTDGVLFNKKDKILVAYPMTAKPGAYRVPSGAEAIGQDAFWNCTSLTSVIMPEGLESISEFTFTSCSSLGSVVLPEGLRSIGDGAFEDCTHLVLAVPQDSFAQQYAQDNGIPYEVIGK